MKSPKASDYDLRMVRREDLEILPWVTRDEMPEEDAKLRESIARMGIQEALNAVEDGGKLYLADGLRRMRESTVTNLPVLVDRVPDGQTVESYIRKLRFHLDHFRQNLSPTVRAQEVVEMRKALGLGVKQVAKYINVDPDTVRNWTRILEYPAEVQKAIDLEKVGLRVVHFLLNGFTKEAQKEIWRRHADEMNGANQETAKTIRAMYEGKQFAEWRSEQPKPGPKTKKPRVVYAAEDKRRLFASVSVQKSTAMMAEKEKEEIRARCKAVARLARATIRTPELRKEVAEGMLGDLKRFAEVSALYG